MSRYPAARFTAFLLKLFGWVTIALACLPLVFGVVSGRFSVADLSPGGQLFGAMAMAGAVIVGIVQIAVGQVLSALLDGVENSFRLVELSEALSMQRPSARESRQAEGPSVWSWRGSGSAPTPRGK